MTHDLAFLHTAKAHVETFQSLVDELAPTLKANHTVNESLLHDAVSQGRISTELQARIELAMNDAASTGSPVVVCTCSTIGGIAENITTPLFSPMRIDRAMAGTAVKSGKNILLAAAVKSTLAPTRTLLETSAHKAGARVEIHDLLISDAWQAFQSGDTDNYIDLIASKIATNISGMDCVVLAQASMTPAADRCAGLGIPVFSSPRLGVEAAIRSFKLK